MNETILQATYSDLKFIKTRKVWQIICEVPLEHFDKVNAALGSPNPEFEKWVAIAPLNISDDGKVDIASLYRGE